MYITVFFYIYYIALLITVQVLYNFTFMHIVRFIHRFRFFVCMLHIFSTTINTIFLVPRFFFLNYIHILLTVSLLY